MQPETKAVLDILEACGARDDCLLWRNNTGALKVERRLVRFGCPGSADILGVYAGGRAIGIEVKSAFGVMSSNQKRWRKLFEAQGGAYTLARSPAEAAAFLDSLATALRGGA